MPPEELPFKWRQVATPITVTAAAFAQLVLENRLETYCHGGYCWAAKKTEDGHDLYRTFDNWYAFPQTINFIARPAAGANFAAVAVPTGHKWKLLAAYWNQTTDVNAANRYPYLAIKTTSAAYTEAVVSDLPIVASQTTVFVSFLNGGLNTAGVATSGLGIMIGMGNDIVIEAGGSFQPVLMNIQAGDRPDAACYYVYQDAVTA